jgi:D-serine deaminase-like pyridoxal phosphate-dependent protein
MRLDDLETPVPLIDVDCVGRNLRAMQAYADAAGLALRPHIKTHKLPRFARQQMRLGAVGITCQKIGEAEVMADAGPGEATGDSPGGQLDDMLLSYPPVGRGKPERLAALARRVARLRVAVDSALALEAVAEAGRQAGRPLGVLIEFDSGMRRTGVTRPEQARALARQAAGHGGPGGPVVRFDGLMTYPAGPSTAAFVAETRDLLARDGLDLAVVSIGGTPTAARAHTVAGATELRVGTYIYNDRMVMAAGAAGLDDCAMHVLATVVSRPTEDRAIIDAGSKTLSSDLLAAGASAGYGLLVDYPEAVLERLSEEHGMLDLSRCDARPSLGERVRIVPNHCCVVTNLHDEVVLVSGGAVVETLRVAARGKTR